MEKIRLGISACLLGEPVRYDGGHKLDSFLKDTLGRYVEYVPVCPEVEVGLGVPREPMHLAGNPARPRLVTTDTRRDLTEQMEEWARERVNALEKEGLSGFIFKSRSPSSGMERVKVYNAKGVPAPSGSGIFARIFMEHFPLLPVEDEGRLHDPVLRENFIESVFTLTRWREALKKRRVGELVAFHSRHKLLLMSHSPKHLSAMGKLAASGKTAPPAKIFSEYQRLLLEALRIRTTVRKHTNVLQHIMGYFKKSLSPEEKQELVEVIRQYHNGIIPLIVPVTLLNHYVLKYPDPYLQEQVYLHPHPVELQLRNHV